MKISRRQLRRIIKEAVIDQGDFRYRMHATIEALQGLIDYIPNANIPQDVKDLMQQKIIPTLKDPRIDPGNVASYDSSDFRNVFGYHHGTDPSIGDDHFRNTLLSFLNLIKSFEGSDPQLGDRARYVIKGIREYFPKQRGDVKANRRALAGKYRDQRDEQEFRSGHHEIMATLRGGNSFVLTALQEGDWQTLVDEGYAYYLPIELPNNVLSLEIDHEEANDVYELLLSQGSNPVVVLQDGTLLDDYIVGLIEKTLAGEKVDQLEDPGIKLIADRSLPDRNEYVYEFEFANGRKLISYSNSERGYPHPIFVE